MDLKYVISCSWSLCLYILFADNRRLQRYFVTVVMLRMYCTDLHVSVNMMAVIAHGMPLTGYIDTVVHKIGVNLFAAIDGFNFFLSSF